MSINFIIRIYKSNKKIVIKIKEKKTIYYQNFLYLHKIGLLYLITTMTNIFLMPFI